MSDDASRLEVTCPSCGKLYRVKRELAGKTAKCGCGAKLAIPTTAAPAAPSQTLTTELVLPPDNGKLELSDDEYELEPLSERPVSEGVRRAVASANSNDLMPRPGNLGPTPPPASAEPNGSSLGPSTAAFVFRVSIMLVFLSAVICLWMGIRVIDSAYAVREVAQLRPRSLYVASVSSQWAEFDQELAAFNLANLFGLSTSMLAFIAYLAWIYASHSRLKALGTANLRFTPGWAVGYHLVPFWNLIRPYQIMREIWHGSDPAGATLNDCSRQHVKSCWLVRVWWILALSGPVAGIYLFFRGVDEMRALPPRPSGSQFVDTINHWVRLHQATLLVPVLYNVFTLILIRSIERRQTAPRSAANYRFEAKNSRE